MDHAPRVCRTLMAWADSDPAPLARRSRTPSGVPSSCSTGRSRWPPSVTFPEHSPGRSRNVRPSSGRSERSARRVAAALLVLTGCSVTSSASVTTTDHRPRGRDDSDDHDGRSARSRPALRPVTRSRRSRTTASNGAICCMSRLTFRSTGWCRSCSCCTARAVIPKTSKPARAGTPSPTSGAWSSPTRRATAAIGTRARAAGVAVRENHDDVGFLEALIDHLDGFAQIDPARVVLVGHSNGGMMAYRLACDPDCDGVRRRVGGRHEHGGLPAGAPAVVPRDPRHR